MWEYWERIRTFLTATVTQTAISITEYFVCGWLILTGIQSFVGWLFAGPWAHELGHVLLYVSILFIFTGLGFIVIKAKNYTRWHSNMLLFIYCQFSFAFIVEIIVIPAMVGLWIGALLLSLLTGIFYLRIKILKLG